VNLDRRQVFLDEGNGQPPSFTIQGRHRARHKLAEPLRRLADPPPVETFVSLGHGTVWRHSHETGT
jgi:hypothetical protein